MEILFYLFLFALLASAAVAIMWVYKGYLNGESPTTALFGARPERRLAIIEQASVDSRRRLMLIRRDGVEHLIMTGGPVDVVIETGIGATGTMSERRPHRETVADAIAAQPVVQRQARTFGQAAERTPERAAE